MNERSIEYSYALEWLWRIWPQTILDIGSGVGIFPLLVTKCGFKITAIDSWRSYWHHRIKNPYFNVVEDDILNPQIAGHFDMIFCISTLEHIKDHNLAVKNMFNLLNPGGYLLMTFPFNFGNYIGNVYDLPGAGWGSKKHICQVFSQNEIQKWQKQLQFEIISHRFYRLFDGEYWSFGKSITPIETDIDHPHQLSAIVIKKGKGL
ncbi:MAG: class I SAM-dependent methyltransferase [Candidatus Marinimicrobia bacterium]|jgi:2-polyprenyl-3-methyl-5-hydroxy-6-metoxy-1,4-benzoquinol methylase|nr:class I SAM-dependent methyltransferase [Candidatus Neomarinimicrobiota bacterium]MDD5539321.1 class I SAM-dependent methyltransferase [Candidatus Neomarinimicrobiota bacterium]